MTKQLGLEDIFEDPTEVATLDSLILQMIFQVVDPTSLSAVQSWLYVSNPLIHYPPLIMALCCYYGEKHFISIKSGSVNFSWLPRVKRPKEGPTDGGKSWNTTVGNGKY